MVPHAYFCLHGPLSLLHALFHTSHTHHTKVVSQTVCVCVCVSVVVCESPSLHPSCFLTCVPVDRVLFVAAACLQMAGIGGWWHSKYWGGLTNTPTVAAHQTPSRLCFLKVITAFLWQKKESKSFNSLNLAVATQKAVCHSMTSVKE